MRKKELGHFWRSELRFFFFNFFLFIRRVACEEKVGMVLLEMLKKFD